MSNRYPPSILAASLPIHTMLSSVLCEAGLLAASLAYTAVAHTLIAGQHAMQPEMY